VFLEFREEKMELTVNGKFCLQYCCKQKTEIANFRLFAANGNGNGSLFSLVGKL
jgi:5-formaminoimidazole-4-carboxamide-1-beta-D-ribofuranosyl 5'-monophosphate synthetase